MFFFIPWVIVVFLRAYGPISHEEISLYLVVFIGLSILLPYLSYIIGFFLVRSESAISQLPEKSNFIGENNSNIDRIAKFLLVLAFIFPVVALFDFLFLKGASLGGIVALREAEHMSGPRNSLSGALITLLSAISPIFYVFIMENYELARKKKIIYSLIAFVGICCLFLSGGRNGFFISILFIFFYSKVFFANRAESKVKSSLLSKFILYSALLFFFFFSLNIFIERFSIQGFEVGYMLEYLEREYSVKVSKPEGLTGFLLEIYSVLIYLIFYVTHSFTYLNQYFAIDYEPFLSGGYNFPLLARVFDILFGFDIYSSGRSALLIEGVYLTLPGSLYVDFGFIGSILFLCVCSFYFGFMARNVKKLYFYERFLFCYLLVAFTFSPIYGVFGTANGFSFLIIMSLVFLVSTRFKLSR